ncbi:MAG: hypothetical protein KDB22_03540 [Planctomycetales bacterium]|nr:hypothetical protein [Planctomycetales bacterium]
MNNRYVKPWAELGFALLLIAMLIGMDQMLGRPVMWLGAVFAALWFGIAMILLLRPPGVPEFVTDQSDPDEHYVIRRDVAPRLPLLQRLRWSLCVACGSCLLIWLTLTLAK